MRHNHKATQQLYAKLLRKCTQHSNPYVGRAIHASVVKSSSPPYSLYLHNHLLNMYARSGHLVFALKLFDEMPQRNAVSWTSVLAGLVRHTSPAEALSFFSLMHREATVLPNEFTLISALHACSLYEDSVLLYLVYAYIVRLGFASNVFLMNAFLTGLIRHGRLREAKVVFDCCLEDKDIVSWNAMMGGLLQHSYLEVPSFWYRMMCEGVNPDNYTFGTVLSGLAATGDLRMGVQVHAQLVKSGHGGEICIGNSLCDMYVKNQMLEDGFKVFNEMPCKNVRSWTQMAAGSVQCGEPGKGLEVIEEMKEMGVQPNKFTLATAFNACANLASLEDGKRFHGLRIKLGSEVDVCAHNSLLDMYVKCGDMDAAWLIFKSMRESSIVSWTTMIMGCAQNGQAREALEVFDEMRLEGIEPNYVTYIGLLYACGQGGFIDKAWRYFSSMFCDHGITPGEDHYVCMVNILGRAGRIREAEELISRMPFQPGVLVWQTLLGACQLHGDVEAGKRAAERAKDLDETDSSTYVLLSNMFAGVRNWDDVGLLRKLMERRDVKKMPGSSWIEMGEA